MEKQIPGPDGGLWGLKNVRAFARGETGFLHGLAKEYGEIVRFQMGPLQFSLVSNPDHVGEILVTQASKFEKSARDRLVMGRLLGQGLVTSEGELHRKQRLLMQPVFRKKQIGMYAEAICKHTEEMLAGWKEGQRLDVAEEMMELTMKIVSEVLFHSDVSGQAKRIGKAISIMQDVANQDFRSPLNWPRWFPLLRNIRGYREKRYLHKVIQTMISSRRQEEREGKAEQRHDLLSLLLKETDEAGQGMSDAQLRDEVLTLFVAGHETTSNALSWTLYLLSQNPSVRVQLHEELDRVLRGRPATLEDLPQLPYLQMVLKESMRLYPPVWTLNARTPKEDVVLEGGYRLPAGTLVFVTPYVLHRNPRFFPEPEKFDPTRFSPENEEARHRFAYIPFGAGHRVCIGNAFAMMEGSLLLARIAQRFTLELEPDAKIERRSQISMSPAHGLPMRLRDRPWIPASARSDAKTSASLLASPSGCPFHPARSS